MSSTLSIALSGLNANAARAATSANNIANMRSTGPADQPEKAYQPQVTTTQSAGGAGVKATTRPVDPATTTAFSPSDANANSDGLVAMPNVSLETELVEQDMAVIAYKANASVVRTQNSMDKSLLDLMV